MAWAYRCGRCAVKTAAVRWAAHLLALAMVGNTQLAQVGELGRVGLS